MRHFSPGECRFVICGGYDPPWSCPEHIVQIGLADGQFLSVPVNYTPKPLRHASVNKKGPDFHQDRF